MKSKQNMKISQTKRWFFWNYALKSMGNEREKYKIDNKFQIGRKKN